jgi:hypothetical protein
MAGGDGNPAFKDIVALLNTLFNNDPNIDSSPHLAFWQNISRDDFVKITTDAWGVPGPLVKTGDATHSNLFLSLAGHTPFDGSLAPRMPDTDSDPAGRYATDAELAQVALWINNGAPA